jgi:hypothetical protein
MIRAKRRPPRSPQARSRSFIDTTLVQEVEASGFLKQLDQHQSY